MGVPKVIVKNSLQHGKGVFASCPIKIGEVILAFSGPLVHRSQVDWDDYHLQVGEDEYMGPSGCEDDFVNHSCSPNSAFDADLRLVALRDIATGEEITWDYGTAIDEVDFEGFPCRCGAPMCRGSVVSFRYLHPSMQKRLMPWALPYIKRKYFPEKPQS